MLENLSDTIKLLGSGVTLLTLLSAVVIGYVRLVTKPYENIQSKFEKYVEEYVDAQLSVVKSRVDDLWSLYIMDAVKERLSSGLTQKNSPETATGLFSKAIPLDLTTSIVSDIKSTKKKSDIDLTAELWFKYKKDMISISEATGISPKALLGALHYLIETHSER